MERTIVCFSDTHSLHNKVILPTCDIAIFAGDFSGRGGEGETTNFLEWYDAQKQCTNKIMVAGNHDLCFDPKYNLDTRAAEWLTPLMKRFPDIIYLDNGWVEVDGLRIWGSPITPDFYPQHWAFNKPRGEDIREVWNRIPSTVDIVVTHGPVYGIGDECQDGNVGCEDLADTIKRIKPKLHVFGHIHEGYGISEKHGTTFVNAAICDGDYNPVNKPLLLTL